MPDYTKIKDSIEENYNRLTQVVAGQIEGAMNNLCIRLFAGREMH